MFGPEHSWIDVVLYFVLTCKVPVGRAQEVSASSAKVETHLEEMLISSSSLILVLALAGSQALPNWQELCLNIYL